MNPKPVSNNCESNNDVFPFVLKKQERRTTCELITPQVHQLKEILNHAWFCDENLFHSLIYLQITDKRGCPYYYVIREDSNLTICEPTKREVYLPCKKDETSNYTTTKIIVIVSISLACVVGVVIFVFRRKRKRASQQNIWSENIGYDEEASNFKEAERDFEESEAVNIEHVTLNESKSEEIIFHEQHPDEAESEEDKEVRLFKELCRKNKGHLLNNYQFIKELGEVSILCFVSYIQIILNFNFCKTVKQAIKP